LTFLNAILGTQPQIFADKRRAEIRQVRIIHIDSGLRLSVEDLRLRNGK
jgi:hypothetical protein